MSTARFYYCALCNQLGDHTTDGHYIFTKGSPFLPITTMTTLDEIADAVHANAKAKGFHPAYEPLEVFIANQCNNIHGEVQELWDAWRAGKQEEPCDKGIGLTYNEEELADIIIRALDVSRRLRIDIRHAIEVKHKYNLTRPHKHGKKN